MPSIINAVATLLYTRNRLMNCNAFINMCILRRGLAKKETFDRFHKIGLCLSYSNLPSKLTELGKNFDQPVKELMNSCDIQHQEFKETILQQLQDSEEIPIIKESQHTKIKSNVNQESPFNLSGAFGNLSLTKHKFNKSDWLKSKIMQVSDNVVIGTKRRHYTISKSNTDLHLFHIIAVSIDFHLSGITTIVLSFFFNIIQI